MFFFSLVVFGKGMGCMLNGGWFIVVVIVVSSDKYLFFIFIFYFYRHLCVGGGKASC